MNKLFIINRKEVMMRSAVLEELMNYIEKALKNTFNDDLDKPLDTQGLRSFINNCIQELKGKYGEHTIPYLVLAFVLLYSIKPQEVFLVLAQYTASLFVLENVSKNKD
jgi:hypothetical protein